MDKLKYPIGIFQMPSAVEDGLLKQWLEDIASLPEQLEQEVKGLSPEQLEWPYRPEGWNIRQVVHHLADSHLNAYIRFKLSLTEESPTIKPYWEHLWAELPDMDAPIEDSLLILRGLHRRWVRLLGALSTSDLQRTFMHPEHQKTFSLLETVGLYAWHSQHHLAHVKQAIAHQGDFS